jgi:outer membrane immunogenic protein
MKTRILKNIIAFSMLLLPLGINAQVSLNVKHGIVASTFSKIGNLGDNEHITLSYTAGVFAIVPMSNSISIQPELNYIRKGRLEEFSTLGVSNKTKSSAEYLQIPVMIRYTPADVLGASKAKLFFNAGMYEGILLHSETRIKSGNELTGVDQTDAFKHTDFGLVFGGGVQFPCKQFLVQFDLRYDMGLTKITNQNDNYHTKALSLTMGVKF